MRECIEQKEFLADHGQDRVCTDALRSLMGGVVWANFGDRAILKYGAPVGLAGIGCAEP